LGGGGARRGPDQRRPPNAAPSRPKNPQGGNPDELLTGGDIGKKRKQGKLFIVPRLSWGVYRAAQTKTTTDWWRGKWREKKNLDTRNPAEGTGLEGEILRLRSGPSEKVSPHQGPEKKRMICYTSFHFKDSFSGTPEKSIWETTSQTSPGKIQKNKKKTALDVHSENGTNDHHLSLTRAGDQRARGALLISTPPGVKMRAIRER